MNAVFEYKNPLNKLLLNEIAQKFKVGKRSICRYAAKYERSEKFRNYFEIMHKKTFEKIMDLKEIECQTVDEDDTFTLSSFLTQPIAEENGEINFDKYPNRSDEIISMEILDPNFSLLIS